MSLPQGTAQQEQLEHRSRRTVSGMFFIKCECLVISLEENCCTQVKFTPLDKTIASEKDYWT